MRDEGLDNGASEFFLFLDLVYDFLDEFAGYFVRRVWFKIDFVRFVNFSTAVSTLMTRYTGS